jgi:hypothetical protein
MRTAKQPIHMQGGSLRRQSVIYSVTFIILLAGCTTSRALNRFTIRQVSSFNEIVESQILDNVAAFQNSRAALPHFALVGDGTTQLYDQGAVSPAIGWGPKGFTTATFGLSGTRNLMENWKLSPVLTAGRVRRMRCAFQFIFAYPQLAVEVHENQPDTKCKSASQTADKCKYYDVTVIGDDPCARCVHDFVEVGLLPAPRCCDIGIKAASASHANPGTATPAAATPTAATPTAAKLETDKSEPDKSETGNPTADHCDSCNSLDDAGCYLGECPPGHWHFKTIAAANAYSDTLRNAIRCNFPQNWFEHGNKEAAKCQACRYGVDCDTYAWVKPGRQDEFARFTITVLALATLDPPAAAATQQKKDTTKNASNDVAQTRVELALLMIPVQSALREVQSGEDSVATAENAAKTAIEEAIARKRFGIIRGNDLELGKDVGFKMGQVTGMVEKMDTRTVTNEELVQLKNSIKSLEVVEQLQLNQGVDAQIKKVLDLKGNEYAASAAVDQILLARMDLGPKYQKAIARIAESSPEVIKRMEFLLERTRDDLDAIEMSVPAPPQDAFGRPGSMPLSRPTPGAEFTPAAIP